MTSAGRPPIAGEWGGAVVSSTSIASNAGLKAASRAATRTGTFRGDRSARADAALTVSRETPCRRDSSRIDSPSTRASRRTRANSSTRNLMSALHRWHHTKPDVQR